MKNEEIKEAWRIIGEQPEWILNMLNIHKDDVETPPEPIRQFFHYFFDMTATGKLNIKLKAKYPGCEKVQEFLGSLNL